MVRVVLGAVGLGGVEEGVPHVGGLADEAHRLVLVRGCPVCVTEPHAAESDRRHLERLGARTEGSRACHVPLLPLVGSLGRPCRTPDTTLCRGRMPRKSPWVGLL